MTKGCFIIWIWRVRFSFLSPLNNKKWRFVCPVNWCFNAALFVFRCLSGALYIDGTWGKLKQDDMVPPNGSHTYIWSIPENFAPLDSDPNCMTWAYHSHINPARDTNSGLIGALLTCKKGKILPIVADLSCLSARCCRIRVFTNANFLFILGRKPSDISIFITILAWSLTYFLTVLA